MRVRLALATLAGALMATSSTAAPEADSSRVAFIRGHDLVVLDLATGEERVVLGHAGAGQVAWSGDGQLVSSGVRVSDGTVLPGEIIWAPSGRRGAYITPRGGVVDRTPTRAVRVVPDGWGATGLAWSPSGRLAIGRSLCRVPCGIPTHREIWVWDGQMLRLKLKLPDRVGTPMPVAWTSRGRIVWWLYPDSASIAADGVSLHAGTRRIGTTLMYPDYVVRCGRGLAFVDGGDRFSTHGKRIVVAGHDVSRDRSRSWVSPSCSRDGATLVAAAGRDFKGRFGREHRAIWHLRPVRRRLTRPPAGWTDENPRVLADGSVLFIRTREASRKVGGEWYVTVIGKLELLRGGGLTTITTIRIAGSEFSTLGSINYYGHYGWPRLVAISQ